MEKSKKDNKITNEPSGIHFLKKENLKKDLAQEHKEFLGLDVPDDYFSKSKKNILKNLKMENEQKRTVFGLKPFIAYPIAASILLLIAITFWMQNKSIESNLKVTDVDAIETVNELSTTEDFLVSSLLVDDSKMDQYIDDYILNEIIVEAELSEQQLEDIFINSLFVEDSLINIYIDNNLIENIIL